MMNIRIMPLSDNPSKDTVGKLKQADSNNDNSHDDYNEEISENVSTCCIRYPNDGAHQTTTRKQQAPPIPLEICPIPSIIYIYPEEEQQELHAKTIVKHVFPFLDRTTINSLLLASKQVYQYYKKYNCVVPWPTCTLSSSGVARTMTFSNDSKWLACAIINNTTSNSKIMLWHSYYGRQKSLQKHLDADMVAFSPVNTNLLAIGCEGKSIHLWDLQSNIVSQFKSPPKDKQNNKQLGTIAWAPNGKTIASGRYNSTIQLWNVQTKTCTHELFFGVLPPPTVQEHAQYYNDNSHARPNLIKKSNNNYLKCLTFSPLKNEVLIAFGIGPALCTWNISQQENNQHYQKLEILSDPNDCIQCVSFSPDGKYLACGTFFGQVRIWKLDSSKGPKLHCVLTRKRNKAIHSIQFSSSHNQQLVSVDGNGGIFFWNWKNEQTCLSKSQGYTLCMSKNNAIATSNLELVKLTQYPN